MLLSIYEERKIYKKYEINQIQTADFSSFDEFVRFIRFFSIISFYFRFMLFVTINKRHLLRPTWLLCRRSEKLESVVSFAATVLETLQAVHEQVQRRTMDEINLNKSIECWENLIRQIRVSLLLQSRTSFDEFIFTVEKLSNGDISMHRLLAIDTLCFVSNAKQAIEHEERCQEVYKSRLSQLNTQVKLDRSREMKESDLNQTKKSEILLAWGATADSRWRDIISVAASEDAVDDVSTSSVNERTSLSEESDAKQSTKQQKNKHVRRRRPLLLYFPQHYHPLAFGAYRSIILCERLFIIFLV
jgi:hypothetical protein